MLPILGIHAEQTPTWVQPPTTLGFNFDAVGIDQSTQSAVFDHGSTSGSWTEPNTQTQPFTHSQALGPLLPHQDTLGSADVHSAIAGQGATKKPRTESNADADGNDLSTMEVPLANGTRAPKACFECRKASTCPSFLSKSMSQSITPDGCSLASVQLSESLYKCHVNMAAVSAPLLFMLSFTECYAAT